MVDATGERSAMTNGKGRAEGLDARPGGRYDRNRNRDAALTEAAIRRRAQSCVMAVGAAIGAAKRVHTEHNGHHHQNDGTRQMSHGRLILPDDLLRKYWRFVRRPVWSARDCVNRNTGLP